MKAPGSGPSAGRLAVGPPAGSFKARAGLITLGEFKPEPKDPMVVVSGIVIISVVGELLRQARLIQTGRK